MTSEARTAAYVTRGLEINGDSMWRYSEINRALELIERYQMTALIINEPDLLNRALFPKAYFPPFSAWSGAPPRRGENQIYNNAEYLRTVSRRCLAMGIEFWVNLKELTFPDEVLERTPDIINAEGIVCPTHPAWAEFVEVKYQDLCEEIPDLTGVILSVGSPEGRATLASGRCRCDRCGNTEPETFYRSITEAAYRPLSEAGKRLVVREFSYNPTQQEAVIAGLASLPDDIEFCAKPYARDYYPTYPDNPAMGALPGRTRWLELDVNGQFYGWGVFPCPVIEDQARRLRRGVELGATHVLYRTDWERVNDLSALRSFSGVNLATGALLAIDPEREPIDVLSEALHLSGISHPQLASEARTELAADLLKLWPIVAKSLYIRGFVYNTSSRIPDGVDYAWWNLGKNHSLALWEPEAVVRIDVKDRETTAAMLSEKDAGRAEMEALAPVLDAWVRRGALRIPDVCDLGDTVAFARRYIDAFVTTGKITILSGVANQREGGLDADEHAALVAERNRLASLIEELVEHRERGTHTHHVEVMVSIDRMRRMLSDADRVLELESV